MIFLYYIKAKNLKFIGFFFLFFFFRFLFLITSTSASTCWSRRAEKSKMGFKKKKNLLIFLCWHKRDKYLNALRLRRKQFFFFFFFALKKRYYYFAAIKFRARDNTYHKATAKEKRKLNKNSRKENFFLRFLFSKSSLININRF